MHKNCYLQPDNLTQHSGLHQVKFLVPCKNPLKCKEINQDENVLIQGLEIFDFQVIENYDMVDIENAEFRENEDFQDLGTLKEDALEYIAGYII